MNPLRSLPDYETFIYTLPQLHPIVRRSTLVVIRRGPLAATVQGDIELPQGFRLLVREHLIFTKLPGSIRSYGYEIWRGEQLLYWYDSQPHPNNPELASTHPHHKHVPPEITYPGAGLKL